MKLIDKDAVLAEIERKRDAALTRQHNLEAIGQVTVLNETLARELSRIISFIDTLEVKEVKEEPVSEDLEEEIERCWKDWVSSEEDEVEGLLIKSEFEEYAIHFAQWQRAQIAARDKSACEKKVKEADV